MAGADRRLIAPLLLPFFPTMEKATSNDWHGFLNAKTGLAIDLSEPNATAFDKWRQALAKQFSLPVWGYTKEQIAAIQAQGEKLVQAEADRVSALPQKLALLNIAAPTKTVADLIKDAKRVFRA